MTNYRNLGFVGMTVGDFKKFLADNNVPDDTPIVNTGHYGEFDSELLEASYEDVPLEAFNTRKRAKCVVLTGFATTYPEPG